MLVFTTFLAKSSTEVIVLKDLPSFVDPRPLSWLVVDPGDSPLRQEMGGCGEQFEAEITLETEISFLGSNECKCQILSSQSVTSVHK